MKNILLSIIVISGVLVGFNQVQAQSIYPVYITTVWLPYGTIGSNYSAQVNAYGGSDSYVWSVSAGNLPPGLILNQAYCIQAPCQVPVLISGIPTVAGVYYFTIRVASGSATASRQYYITVRPDTTAPYISNITVTNITPYSATINWMTNEPADGQVEFCATYTRCGNNTPIDPVLVLQHSVTLSSLAPNTYYYAWIKSKDATGNLRESYRTFRTL